MCGIIKSVIYAIGGVNRSVIYIKGGINRSVIYGMCGVNISGIYVIGGLNISVIWVNRCDRSADDAHFSYAPDPTYYIMEVRVSSRLVF